MTEITGIAEFLARLIIGLLFGMGSYRHDVQSML